MNQDAWQETAKGLYRKFLFKDFEQAFSFMERVAAEAAQQQHHPRWTNEWNTVEIWLSTHEAKRSVTDKDRALAEAIDQIFGA